MSKLVIIADDLTGANATSVLLVRQGFKAVTFLNLDKYNAEEHKDLNVVSISTDSRGVERDTAYQRVKDVVDFFKEEEVSLFAKRIDSTLRGNIGVEISAILDNLDDDTMAIVVPSFPSSGRVCIGGYLMVNQLPLEKTDVAKDPKTPIFTSSVVQLIGAQTDYKIGFIELDKVLKGIDSIESSIISEKEKGSRVIVIDATSDDDILKIARAIKNTGIKTISVDPGPFTAALAEEYLEIPSGGPGQKVMLTVGSVSNLTRKQLDEVRMKYSPLFVNVSALKLIYDESRQDEINKVVGKLVKDVLDYDVIGVITTSKEDEVLDLHRIARELEISEDDVSQRISDGLAEITTGVLEKTDSLIGGLFTSGGDVTVAVCKALGSAGIEVKDEVLPLAVYGRITKGPHDNMPIITKGGLIGDDKATIICVEYLLTKLSNEYHTKDIKI